LLFYTSFSWEERKNKKKEKMRNLEQDLRFFEQELERERDPFRRNLILGQICEIKQEILNNLRRERAQAERENKNLQEALEAAIQMKKK
jgi:lysyl-tRNA synthetase class I